MRMLCRKKFCNHLLHKRFIHIVYIQVVESFLVTKAMIEGLRGIFSWKFQWVVQVMKWRRGCGWFFVLKSCTIKEVAQYNSFSNFFFQIVINIKYLYIHIFRNNNSKFSVSFESNLSHSLRLEMHKRNKRHSKIF